MSIFAKDHEHRHIAGLLREARAACPYDDVSEWMVYSQIVSPFLVNFVEWIISDALKREVKILYFLARDGQILHKIAKALTACRNIPIECRYLYASRQALHLPGHVSISQSRSWIMDDTDYLSIRAISERLAIPVELFGEKVRKKIDVDFEKNLSKDERRILSLLLEENSISKLIDESSKEKLDLAVKYFRQEGVISDEIRNIGIVDVGWHGRLQRSIDNILSKCDIFPSYIHGYYLALFDSMVYSDATRTHAFMYSPYQPATSGGEWILSNLGMMELFHSADHPSTMSYSADEYGRYGPVFLDHSVSNNSVFRQEAILSFANRYAALSGSLGRSIELGKVNNRLRRLLERPSIEEAKIFSKYYHSEHQVEMESVPFVRKMTLMEAFRKPPSRTHGLWPAGSHVITGTFIYYYSRNIAFRVKRIISRWLMF
ncbi:hypothetical protein [Delftia acidovorans]|uniref:hypothetical protein n=1 Tax=Delftia acidovorans TaxID=80866 RepID=UPI0012D2E278|nr:hypothetical protein [Delftia acidovorans]QQB50542.1 hypothetical protein I6H54_30155 [Delftia acidovorans]